MPAHTKYCDLQSNSSSLNPERFSGGYSTKFVHCEDMRQTQHLVSLQCEFPGLQLLQLTCWTMLSRSCHKAVLGLLLCICYVMHLLRIK